MEGIVITLVVVGALISLYGAFDASSLADEAWREARQSKLLWIVLQVVLGPLLTLVYVVAIRPKVAPPLRPTPGPPTPVDAERVTAALEPVGREAGVSKPDPILVVTDMRRSFGGLVAVDVDHLEVERGSITALIGPNGAGKTTFFNLLTGFGEADSGVAIFDGQKLWEPKPHDLARGGMVRTFQLTKALSKLTVIENMMLGAPAQRGENFVQALVPAVWRGQEKEIQKRADALLERFRMDHMRDEYAGELSGGQRKLLEMARSLMVNPQMIMLDEPMAGVNPALTQSLLEHIKEMRAEGVTVLFIEHDMDVVSSISDWVVVMAEGRIIAEDTPTGIGQNKAVIDAYLGAHHDAPLTEELEEQVLEQAEAAMEAELEARAEAGEVQEGGLA